MSEDDLDRMQARLSAWDGPPLEYLDGLFSALVVGPSLVPMSEYWPQLWEGQEPAWESEADLREAVETIVALWNHIAWRVSQPIPGETDDPELGLRLLPFLALPGPAAGDDEGGHVGKDGDADQRDILAGIPDDYPFASLWAAGFLRGVRFRLEAWADWMEAHEDIADDLRRVHQLSLFNRQHARDLGKPEDEVLDLRQRLEESQYLPEMLEQMNLQRLQDQPRVPARRAVNVGRNDPCPCGSGRKYKKCCGDRTALH